MTKLVFLTFAAAAIAAPALAGTPLAFTYEGHKIVGDVSQDGNIQVITGQDLTSGRAFKLYVKHGYVHGAVDGQLVSYPAPRAKLQTPVAD